MIKRYALNTTTEKETVKSHKNASTKQKPRVLLSVFEKLKKMPEVNKAIRKQSKEKNNRQRL